MELPHVNVLTKIDMLVDGHSEQLPLGLGYYVGVDDLSHLRQTLMLNKHPLSQKFGEFNAMLCELIEDYGLVRFEPLDIQDKECALKVLARCDTANGHVMGAEKVHDPSDPVAGINLFNVSLRETESLEEYLDRYEDRRRAVLAAAEAEGGVGGPDGLLGSGRP